MKIFAFIVVFILGLSVQLSAAPKLKKNKPRSKTEKCMSSKEEKEIAWKIIMKESNSGFTEFDTDKMPSAFYTDKNSKISKIKSSKKPKDESKMGCSLDSLSSLESYDLNIDDFNQHVKKNKKSFKKDQPVKKQKKKCFNCF